jgi:ribose/xylose/arabinose/galactoside ABC-type transport system permease subunit
MIATVGRTRRAAWLPLAMLVALIVAAFATPGFTAVPNIVTLLATTSFVGCIAVGMTFIMLSGNIMSFSLGATMASGAMLYCALSDQGEIVAAAATVIYCMAVSGMQGVLVGYLRANPIIVSIMALSLISGVSQVVSQGHAIYAVPDSLAALKGNVAGIPVAGFVLLAAVISGQLLLRYTHFGHGVILVGSNRRAAVASGVRVSHIVTILYAVAGLYASFSALLIAARYGSADLSYGVGFDYGAVAAILVGGTAISGGSGSVVRTLGGMVVIAVIASILLLRGFETQYQYLLNGIIILIAILAQGRRPT